MQELTTTATLVEYGTFEGGSPITAVLARSELEAALNTDESTRLWFELGLADGGDTARLTLDLTPTDLKEMLRNSTGDEIALALDGDALAGLFDDPDVEAHGLRGAIVIAVASAAILAPAGQAAVAQSASVASTVQGVGVAATSQQVGAAATVQVAGIASKTQVTKQLALRGANLKLLRSGILVR